ncbi:MAG: RluA family pseudouridine synthase [Christensenellales bacterium]
MKLKVIYEDNHLLVVEKPENMPVQQDESKDLDLLTVARQYIKEKYQKPGEAYLGLVHRLDRPVGGVMVFARTSKAAARLSKQFLEKTANKQYLAVVRGQTPEADTLEDYLVKGADRMVKIADAADADAKLARLCYRRVGVALPGGDERVPKEGLSLLQVNLETGRSHQIRVQLASKGFPIWGDARYNIDEHKRGQQIALWACRLELEHPITHEILAFTSFAPQRFPFILFQELIEKNRA